MASLWTGSFDKGVQLFRESKYESAYEHLSEAIRSGADRAKVFDLRANVLEKLGRPKDALKDTKRVIQLSNTSPQGYARAARLFHQVGLQESALTMANHALEFASPAKHAALHVELTALKVSIEAEMEKARKLTSSRTCHVANLPLELLANVFEYAAQTHRTSSVRISHVCGHWRRVALSYPKLWKAMLIHSQDSRKKIERKIKVWAERSQGRLEQLRINANQDVESIKFIPATMKAAGMTPPQILEVYDSFMGHLAISMIFENTFQGSFNPSRFLYRKASNLHGWAHRSLWTTNLQDSASSMLDSLDLEGCDLDFSALPVCRHLRSLSLTRVDTINLEGPYFTRLLAEIPQLESLTLSVSKIRDSPPPDQPFEPFEFTMTNLRELRLSNIRNVRQLLNCLTFPSLEALELRGGTTCGDFLNRLISVSSAGEAMFKLNLRELRLSAVAFKEKDLIAVLGSLGGSLVDLEISKTGQEDMNMVVEALAGGSYGDSAGGIRSSAICPNITTFDFSSSHRLSGGPIKALIKSRIEEEKTGSGVESEGPNQAVPITSLKIDGCPTIQPELLPWLRTNVKRVSCVYETAASIRKSRGRG